MTAFQLFTSGRLTAGEYALWQLLRSRQGRKASCWGRISRMRAALADQGHEAHIRTVRRWLAKLERLGLIDRTPRLEPVPNPSGRRGAGPKQRQTSNEYHVRQLADGAERAGRQAGPFFLGTNATPPLGKDANPAIEKPKQLQRGTSPVGGSKKATGPIRGRDVTDATQKEPPTPVKSVLNFIRAEAGEKGAMSAEDADFLPAAIFEQLARAVTVHGVPAMKAAARMWYHGGPGDWWTETATACRFSLSVFMRPTVQRGLFEAPAFRGLVTRYGKDEARAALPFQGGQLAAVLAQCNGAAPPGA